MSWWKYLLIFAVCTALGFALGTLVKYVWIYTYR